MRRPTAQRVASQQPEPYSVSNGRGAVWSFRQRSAGAGGAGLRLAVGALPRPQLTYL